MKRLLRTLAPLGLLVSPALALTAAPQTAPLDRLPARASQVIVPQNGSFRWRTDQPQVAVAGVAARIALLEQVATTTLEITVRNPGAGVAEAVLVLPVPKGAAVTGFDFEGAASEPTARLLPADEAREIYDEIVRRAKDPALLEFAGYGLIESSVFPVPPQGTQRLRVTFEHLLEADGGRVDYFLPRSESLAVDVPWTVHFDVRASGPISTLYSSSHELDTVRVSPEHLTADMVATWGKLSAGPLRLSYLRQRGDLTATLMACPDEGSAEGTFLLLAGLPADLERELAQRGRENLRREVTLVLDRSGSMAGEKLAQAVAAAKQVLAGLEEGEFFRIVDYSDEVRRFSDLAVAKDRDSLELAWRYLEGLKSQGGTNLFGALAEAVQPAPQEKVLAMVLFLTDGLATVGPTSEVEIRNMVARENKHARRVFSFGVGNDVNAPLLDRLSETTRASATFVSPGEDVEVAVGDVFQQLQGPVLTNLELEPLGGDAGDDARTAKVSHLLPRRLPDLFEGDQLIVLGRYEGAQPLSFRLRGELFGEPRIFTMKFEVAGADPRNTFVPRLWATRRIADLVDGIRQSGATGAEAVASGAFFDDPRYKELADEILRLSTRYGVLSEYTSFLALEGTPLSSWEALATSNRTALLDRAVKPRSGAQAVMTARNWQGQAALSYSNNANVSLQGSPLTGPALAPIVGVQQVANRALFRRGERWIDARLIGRDVELEPDRTVEWGSAAHGELLRLFTAEGNQGVLSFPGEVLLEVDGERVLVRNAGAAEPTPPASSVDTGASEMPALRSVPATNAPSPARQPE